MRLETTYRAARRKFAKETKTPFAPYYNFKNPKVRFFLWDNTSQSKYYTKYNAETKKVEKVVHSK